MEKCNEAFLPRLPPKAKRGISPAVSLYPLMSIYVYWVLVTERSYNGRKVNSEGNIALFTRTSFCSKCFHIPPMEMLDPCETSCLSPRTKMA